MSTTKRGPEQGAAQVVFQPQRDSKGPDFNSMTARNDPSQPQPVQVSLFASFSKSYVMHAGCFISVLEYVTSLQAVPAPVQALPLSVGAWPSGYQIPRARVEIIAESGLACILCYSAPCGPHVCTHHGPHPDPQLQVTSFCIV